MPSRLTITFLLGISLVSLSLGLTHTAQAAYIFDPSLHWRTLHSTNFEIHFHDGEQALAQKVANIAERTRTRLTKYFNWTPADKTQVILADRYDFSNGSSTPIPRNTMFLIVTPADEITFLDNFDDYLTYLISHEYTHIVHIDKARRAPKVMRKIFGRFPWLFPNAYQPDWVIEGIATYQESQRSPNFGRGNNTYYRDLMRNEVVNGLKPLRQVNQPTTDWPMGTTFYLYGVYFFNYLKSHYGDEGIQRWINEYSDNLLPYFINRNSSQVFGKNMDGLWRGFQQYVDKEFLPDIDKRTQRGLSPATQLTHTGYNTGYPVSLPNGDVYYIKTDMESNPKLMLLPQGHGPAREIAEVHGEHFDVHPQQGVLLTQLEITHSTNDYSDLYVIKPHSHHPCRITHGKRYTYATWRPDGSQIAAVHNALGNKRLDLLDNKGHFIKTLWQGQHGEILSQPQWSPDSKTIIAAMWRPQHGVWNLEQFDLAQQKWKLLTHDDNIEVQPRYSDDAQHAIFSANYDGAFNIYQLDLANGDITQLTNTLGGALVGTLVSNPAAKDNGLYYMALNRGGFDLFYLPKEKYFARPVQPAPQKGGMIKTAMTAQADNTTNQSANYPITDYNGLNKIIPTTWFPYGIYDDERHEFGVTTLGSDPLQRHNYSLAAAYDFKNHWATGSFDYLYDRWNPSVKLSGVRDMVAYHDSNNNLLGFTHSDTFTTELLFPLLRRDRQMTFHLGYLNIREANETNKLSAMPNIDTSDKLLGAAISYNSARYYLRSISENDGQRLRLVYEDSDAFQSDYKGRVKTIDWRYYFRLMGENVLATRIMAGRGDKAGSRPFRLGGHNDGYLIEPPAYAPLIPADSVFNRRDYALRGYPTGLAELTGRDINLASVEWRFPIVRIERGWMAPPVGLNQLHGLVFADTGKADNTLLHGDAYHTGIGTELNAELVLGYALQLDLRLGYAHGVSHAGEDQFYLSLGTTF